MNMGPIFKNMIKKKNLKKNWGYITVNLVKYIEIEKIKKEYEKKKNKLCEDFVKNWKEDIKKRNPQIRYVTNYKYEYVESAETRKIREQNAKKEQNREKTSNELPNLLVIVKNDFLIKLKEKISKMKYEI